MDLGEEWDDGNTNNGDGWSSSWTVEFEYSWSVANPSVWVEYECPNGYLESTEQWDDDNSTPGDGWNNIWEIETGWECTSHNPSVWIK